MSERYQNGDATQYEQAQFLFEWETQWKAFTHWGPGIYEDKFADIDERWARKQKPNRPMELAVNALLNAIKQQQYKEQRKVGTMQFKDLGEMGGKNFVKLKDKESITGVLYGDIHDFRQHWNNNKSTPCTGEMCLDCSAGNRSTFRFRLNLITKEGTTYSAKIFEQGAKVYQALKSLHESGYNLEKTIVKITRNGSDRQNTSYSILPIPNHQVTPDTESQLKNVVLNDLINLATENEVPPYHQEQDIPF